MHALCAPPAAMSTTSIPRKDSITRGRSQGLQQNLKQDQKPSRQLIQVVHINQHTAQNYLLI